MADVAMQAGVSVSTVSHVVNRTRPVSSVLETRVLEAILQSGYRPNTVARSLATSDTHLIGVVMSALSNRFFVSVVAAIDRAGRRHGYSSVLADNRDRVGDEADAVNMLLSRRVDGIVLAPAAADKEVVLDKLYAEQVPTVLIDRSADERFDQVITENVEATASLVEHLAAVGHKRIAFLSGRKGVSTSSEREMGFRLGLERSGLLLQKDLVRCGDSLAGPAERAATSLLSRGIAPTAVVSGNYYMTIGLLRALQKSGMRVPQDMAVVGYDDLDFGDVLQPRMTVIAQPISEIATMAVDFLISRITGKAKAREPQTLRLAPTFIHRESCGCGMAAREQRDGGAGLSLVKGLINGA
jgi:LacI family transcriptional regulator